MKCCGEDSFDDMYPEFAPEPIVIDCEEIAVMKVRISCQTFHESGYPFIGVREAHNLPLCRKHFSELEEQVAHCEINFDATKILSFTA